MIDNLRELNEKVNRFVDYVVKTACESTTSGNYIIDIRDALKAVGAGYEDFVEYRDLIINELSAREEILDVDTSFRDEPLEEEYDDRDYEIDVTCALDYCSNYEWCEGDEEVFECSYEEWLKRDVKPVYQACADVEKNVQSIVYFTVRDGFGDDIGSAQYPSFESALKELRTYCAQRGEDADGTMLGIVCKTDEKTHKCVLVQNVINKYNESVLKPMYDNISWDTLAVPEIELAALKGKQLQYPFDEVTQNRIDALEKMLGIYDRDVDVSNDFYVGKWRVHVVEPGGRYGLNNCLTHDNAKSMVEFWDMSVKKSGNFPDGMFVSRYYIETLLEDKWGAGPDVLMQHGLCLDGDNADVWSVSGAEMTKVYEWLKNRDYLPGEYYLECRGDIVGPDFVFSKADGEVLIAEKLSSLAFVKNFTVEHTGSYDEGQAYSVSFVCQANKETVDKSLNKVLDGYNGGFVFEKKVVEVQKEPLDKVIDTCEEVSKNSEPRLNREKSTDKER